MRKLPAYEEMGEENKVNGMAMEYKLSENTLVEEIDYLEIRKDS